MDHYLCNVNMHFVWIKCSFSRKKVVLCFHNNGSPAWLNVMCLFVGGWLKNSNLVSCWLSEVQERAWESMPCSRLGRSDLGLLFLLYYTLSVYLNECHLLWVTHAVSAGFNPINHRFTLYACTAQVLILLSLISFQPLSNISQGPYAPTFVLLLRSFATKQSWGWWTTAQSEHERAAIFNSMWEMCQVLAVARKPPPPAALPVDV